MHLRVDLYEADGEFIIEAEVPRLRPEDLILDIGVDSVRIRVRRRPLLDCLDGADKETAFGG
jgi:HSP20 family molecular chaperone IbpA